MTAVKPDEVRRSFVIRPRITSMIRLVFYLFVTIIAIVWIAISDIYVNLNGFVQWFLVGLMLVVFIALWCYIGYVSIQRAIFKCTVQDNALRYWSLFHKVDFTFNDIKEVMIESIGNYRMFELKTLKL